MRIPLRRLALLLLLLLLLGGVVLGATLVYQLQVATVASGGGNMSGGPYRAETTTGQPASGAVMKGGDYSVASGFWAAPSAGSRSLFLPIFVR